jgi:hypothetical protein
VWGITGGNIVWDNADGDTVVENSLAIEDANAGRTLPAETVGRP